jgi:hypothetical protein
MKDLLTGLDIVPERDVKLKPLCDRLQTFRYVLTRNRAAESLLHLYQEYCSYPLVTRQMLKFTTH